MWGKSVEVFANVVGVWHRPASFHLLMASLNLCVSFSFSFFFSFFIFVKHIKIIKQISALTVTIISRQTELNHVKESERERFWYMKNNHKVYRFNEHRIWGAARTVYYCFDDEWIIKAPSCSSRIISFLQMLGHRTRFLLFLSSICDLFSCHVLHPCFSPIPIPI